MSVSIGFQEDLGFYMVGTQSDNPNESELVYKTDSSDGDAYMHDLAEDEGETAPTGVGIRSDANLGWFLQLDSNRRNLNDLNLTQSHP